MDDNEWFEELVHEHSGAIVRYFARRGPRQDSEDLTADVLLTAWRRRDDVPREAPLPWLYRTAGYVLANHRRRRVDSPVPELPLLADPGDGPEAVAVSRDAAGRALAALSERDREILLLHAWDGLDGESLAQVLGISRSGADAALSRARKRLRDAWDA